MHIVIEWTHLNSKYLTRLVLLRHDSTLTRLETLNVLVLIVSGEDTMYFDCDLFWILLMVVPAKMKRQMDETLIHSLTFQKRNGKIAFVCQFLMDLFG